MVKLQKRFAYKYKDKEHYKHVVTIPEDKIHELGWKVGEELELSIVDSRLVLTHKSRKHDRKDGKGENR